MYLDAKIRPVNGVLAIALEAKKHGFKEIILPEENAKEAAIAAINDNGFQVIGCHNLKQVIDYLENKVAIEPTKINAKELFFKTKTASDIGQIKGQEYAKRAMEISASGGHNLLMEGPPGSGKTILRSEERRVGKRV